MSCNCNCTSSCTTKNNSNVLGDEIKESGGLTDHVSWTGVDPFPPHLHKKLKKFMKKYDEIYELLYSEGIFFVK